MHPASRWGLLASLLVLVLVGSPGASQVPRFAARAELVVLSATAVDRHGRPVRDLRPEELRIFEEGRPQRLVHFALARDSSARVLLLVDASGSMNGQMKAASARMAAYQILAALDPEDEVVLAGFDHRYWGIVPFTRDRHRIRRGFEELEPFSSTALHDALDKAARDLASHGEGRRAVVVITDGVDTSSQRTPDEVIARSRALDVPKQAQAGIAEAKGSAQQAMVRATEAERAAKGKLIYTVTLSNDKVTFPLNHAEVGEDVKRLIDEAIAQLKADNRGVFFEIEGHTDATGPEEYNQKLGYDRALTVRNYLHDQHGIALSRIEVISYGESRPVVDNKTKANRAQNRRVVIKVLE